MVYGDNHETAILSNLVHEFPSLWLDTGFVDIPKDEWMRISLRDDWQTRVTGKAKVYPLGIKDQEVVNKTFDELQQQGRL